MSFIAVIRVIAPGRTFYLLALHLMKRFSKIVDQLDNEKSEMKDNRTKIVAERNKLDDIVSNIDAEGP